MITREQAKNKLLAYQQAAREYAELKRMEIAFKWLEKLEQGHKPLEITCEVFDYEENG